MSQPPFLTPPPSKGRCTAVLQGNGVEEIGEANTPVLKRTILKQQQNNEVTSPHTHQALLCPLNDKYNLANHSASVDVFCDFGL